MTAPGPTTKRKIKNKRRARPVAITEAEPERREETDLPMLTHRSTRPPADPAPTVPVIAPSNPRSLLTRLKRTARAVLGRTNVVSDRDLNTDLASGSGTSQNDVRRASLRITLGSGTDAFFKKYDENLAPSENAVASSRLARALGLTDLIARNKFAVIAGDPGAVSGKVPGRPLNVVTLDARRDPVRLVLADVDFSRPQIQKGLFDLQLFDAITGQIDRHGGNIYVDPTPAR